MEIAKFKNYQITINDDKSVEISLKGVVQKPAKKALQELADLMGYLYDKEWNTQVLGRNLVNFINDILPTGTLNIIGTKKIDTIQREFTALYPYLNICFFDSSAREIVAKGGSIQQLDSSKTLASVRRKGTIGEVSIKGNKKISTVEKELDTAFGLYVQICYTDSDGSGYYTSGSQDEKTLSAFNDECKKDGCIKGVLN